MIIIHAVLKVNPNVASSFWRSPKHFSQLLTLKKEISLTSCMRMLEKRTHLLWWRLGATLKPYPATIRALTLPRSQLKLVNSWLRH